MYIYSLFSPVCRHTSLYRYSDDLVDNVLIWILTLSTFHSPLCLVNVWWFSDENDLTTLSC